mmetsp:Transcript_20762/g.49175  ORF Transcript_20762/g.49175 Transcript_20762/m.49175 type:complete len:320 (-) Transcript_20762:1371-2330(-)
MMAGRAHPRTSQDGGLQLQEDPAGADLDGLHRYRAVQDAARHADRHPQWLLDQPHPLLLHAQGQVLQHQLHRKDRAHPDRLPAARRHPPLLRRPAQHSLRPRPLQARARAALAREEADRHGGQGLREDAQVRRLALPLQGAQASRDGPDVHDHQAQQGGPGLLGAGATAHVPPAEHRPEHAHDPGCRLSQCGQVVLHEQGDARERGGAAVRLHHEVALRGAHGLQVHALAGDRHAGRARQAARGAQHHRDAVDHRAGALALHRAVRARHLGAVRLLAGAADGALQVDPATLRQQAAARGRQQDGRALDGRPAPRRARPD